MTKHLVAVYGSLLSDMHNHHVLGNSKMFDCDLVLTGTLYSLGSFPGLVLKGDTDIATEVYEVDDATLARLDRLEGHPTFYKRTTIGYHMETIPIQVYEWQAKNPRQHIVESGDWKAYYNQKEKDR